jgi:hypothetical protein
VPATRLLSFFDAVDHGHLRRILSRRVRDGVLLRLIGKWLNAGVLEAGEVSFPETGTPQGGVISPLLANLYLHEVVDVWFEETVKPRLFGRAFLIRYADDLAMVFSNERDAERVMAVPPKRFGKYGLTLHPEKTRLVAFRPPPKSNQGGGAGSESGPGSFVLLGFTHYWGRSRRHGYWVVLRKTAKGRFSRALRRVSEWCRRVRHQAIPEQHRQLVLKLKGHYEYYGITGNSAALVRFRTEVGRIWRRWLGTRSWHSRRSWDWFNGLLRRHPLPPAIAVHSTVRPW